MKLKVISRNQNEILKMKHNKVPERMDTTEHHWLYDDVLSLVTGLSPETDRFLYGTNAFLCFPQLLPQFGDFELSLWPTLTHDCSNEAV